MSRSHTYVLRAGFLMLSLSISSYLLAIWTSELTSARFGLTGVVFMIAGVVALILGHLMSPVPASRR